MIKPYILLSAIFFILIKGTPGYSDTITLIEGSVLEGKITVENKDTIVISNIYGTFKIKRKYITSIIYTTKDVSEKPEKPDDIWTNGIISLSGSFNYVLDEIAEKIPYGYSGHIAFDQGMDMITGDRYMIMPGLRLEGGYHLFTKGNYDISGYNSALGLIWVMPSIRSKYGYFILAAMPGICYINIKNNKINETATSTTFTGTALTGYHLPLGSFQLLLHARYTYIYDKDVRFNTIGLEAGFGFKLW